MKKALLSLTLITALVGCNVACQVEQVISSGLASTIAKTLSCSNVDAIQASVQQILSVVKVCAVEDAMKDQKQGPVANIVCPVVASTAVSLLGEAIPATWGCQPAVAGESLSVVIVSACELLPF